MIDLYIDPVLNRHTTVVLNIYESFEFCAQKLVASVKQAFPVHRTINMEFITSKVTLLTSRFNIQAVSFPVYFLQ